MNYKWSDWSDQPVPARVVARVLANSHREGDCLISDYSTTWNGYAVIGWWTEGRRRGTTCHRVVWIGAHGPILDDLTVDHLCRNRRCVNIDHLRLLTRGENSRQGQVRKTHCPAGHAYDEENTYVWNRRRQCRECRRLRQMKGAPRVRPRRSNTGSRRLPT